MTHRILFLALLATAQLGLGTAPAHAYAVAPCDPNGANARDAQLASQLNGQLQAKMRGYMSAYRVSCARMVVAAVKARGLHSRAAVIAITTTIVESSIDNISEEVDHDSLGLFQQRASWGSRAQRLNPTWATNAFLDKMIRLYPNNSWMSAPVGEVCQAVQVSAYPARYQPQAGDGQIIVNALWNPPGRDSVGYFDPRDGTFHLRNALNAGASDYAWSGGPASPAVVPLVGDWNGDGRDSGGYFDRRDGTFHLRNAFSSGASDAAWVGAPADPAIVPLAGDWNGDGRDSVGYFDRRDGTFHLRNALSGGASDYAWGTGITPDLPLIVLAGDWNGDGRDSVGHFDPRDGTFHLRNALNAGASDYAWSGGPASPAVVPLVGDWNGDGRDSGGYFDRRDGTYHLRNALSGGASDYAWGTGITPDLPLIMLAGDWDGS